MHVLPVPGKLPVLDAGAVEHTSGCPDRIGLGVFVRQVDDFPNAGLNDDFGAFVAGKVGDIDRAIVQVGVDLVQDRVEFGVADVRILGVEKVALSRPRILVVRTAEGQPIVTDSDDFLLLVDDTGAHAGVGVLAPERGKQRNAHEIFVPGQIIFAFVHLFSRWIPGEYDQSRDSVADRVAARPRDVFHR